MDIFKFVFTIAFGVSVLLGWILCSVVLIAVFILAVKRRQSSIYIISAGHIIMDIVMLSSFLFYLIPCALANDYIFPGGRTGVYGEIAISLMEFSFLSVTSAQILIAVNRYLVICKPHKNFLDRSHVTMYTVGSIVLALVLTIVAQFGTPCCKMQFNHNSLGFSYILKDDLVNYSNFFINLPFNIISSTVSFVCYSAIVHHVRKSNKLNLRSLGGKRKRDIGFAFQFIAISLFHFIEWVSFRILPFFFESDPPKFKLIFVIIGVCICLNACMNSLVYLLCNQEIRTIVKRLLSFTNPRNAVLVHHTSTSDHLKQVHSNH